MADKQQAGKLLLVHTQKLQFYKYFYAVAVMACVLSGVYDFLAGYYLACVVESLAGAVALYFLIFIHLYNLPSWIVSLSALLSFAVFSTAALTQMDTIYSLVWMPIVPIIFFFLTDYRNGLYWTLAAGLLYVMGFIIHPYIYDTARVSFDIFIQTSAAYIFSSLLAYFYELIRTQNEDMLARNADYDFLTGINNRRSLSGIMEFEISRAQRYQSRLSLLLFDVDDFKQVNDNFGHKVGDVLLQHLAQLAKETIRRADILARWGGEEFAILMPETELSNAEILAEKLRVKIQKHHFSPVGNISISIGVAELRHGELMDDLIHRADQALYQAKNDNKNCVRISRAV